MAGAQTEWLEISRRFNAVWTGLWLNLIVARVITLLVRGFYKELAA